jgi:hypothetical protein
MGRCFRVQGSGGFGILGHFAARLEPGTTDLPSPKGSARDDLAGTRDRPHVEHWTVDSSKYRPDVPSLALKEYPMCRPCGCHHWAVRCLPGHVRSSLEAGAFGPERDEPEVGAPRTRRGPSAGREDIWFKASTDDRGCSAMPPG